MLNVDKSIEKITSSIPFINLWKINQVSEFLERSANDSNYVNKVAHLQQNAGGLVFPLLVTAQFKVDEENTRTITRCITNRVELECTLLCLYDWHVEILNKDIVEKYPFPMYNSAKKMYINGSKNIAQISYGSYDKFVEVNPQDSEFQILLNNVGDFPGHLFLLDEESALIAIECFNQHYCEERKAEFMLELCKLVKTKGLDNLSTEFKEQFIKSMAKLNY